MATTTTNYGFYVDRVWQDSPYLVMLINYSGNARAGTEIMYGLLTQPIQIRLASTYDSITENRESTPLNYLTQNFINKSTVVQTFTTQVWRGVEVPEFSINFTYIGIKSTKLEVVQPVKNLLTWIVPPRNETLLTPPAQKGKACSMIIGDWLNINDLLPVSLDCNFDEVFDTYEHSPIKSEVTMSFIYSHAPTADDVISWFKL